MKKTGRKSNRPVFFLHCRGNPDSVTYPAADFVAESEMFRLGIEGEQVPGFFSARKVLRPSVVCFLVGLVSLISARAQEQGADPQAVDKSQGTISLSEVRTIERAEDYQIHVNGGDGMVRTVIDNYSRSLREDFRGMLRLRRTDWSNLIEIELTGTPDDVVTGRYLAKKIEVGPDGRFRLKLYAKLHDRFDEEQFALEFIEILIQDQMLTPYANSPDQIGGEIEVPEWIVYGFHQLIEHKRLGSPSSFYEGFLKSSEILGTEQIFSVKDASGLTPVNLAIFRASSSVLVDTLIDQPGGHLAIRSMLADLAKDTNLSIAAILRQHFPGFREIDKGMEKWWALQLATLAEQQSFEFLTPQKTEELISQGLQVRFEQYDPELLPEKKKIWERLRFGSGKKEKLPAQSFPMEDFAEYLERPDLASGLKRSHTDFQTALARGFPLYRPVIQRYLQVLEKISEKKTGGVTEELAELEKLRQQVGQTMIRVADYLNYYEATTAPEKSDEFDNYMRLRRELENANFPKRKDRISEYLDAFEAEMD